MKHPLVPMGGMILCAALALTGCAEERKGDLTLVETKSPTQLLRNEAANRLLTGTDDDIVDQKDFSASCKASSEDPDGYWRSWHSSLLVEVPPGSAIGVDQFAAALATSFAQDGWKLSEQNLDGGKGKLTRIKRSDSIVTLSFTSTEGGVGESATIYVEAEGPCVLTDGPESDEVKKLEGRD